MRVLLMHRDRDFDPGGGLPENTEDLTRDLGLEPLLQAMASGDDFVYEVARKALLDGLSEPEEILYRQRALADCLEEAEVVREIHRVAIEAIEGERKVFVGLLHDSPRSILNRAVQVLGMFLGHLRRLRGLADEHAGSFSSEAFGRFFEMVRRDLSDDYLAEVERHLGELEFSRGMLFSARLGRGNRGRDYVLRVPRRQRLLERLPFGDRSGYGFTVPDRDVSGFRALDELSDWGLNRVADVTARSADNILGFFELLRAELAFYVGCLNLRDRLAARGEPLCFPTPEPIEKKALSARGLYDVSLSLSVEGRVVGNDIDADGKGLVMITGANQGGKSTFLRSVGLAQLMMQCGMFVPAGSFRASICSGVFTHYRREEDERMRSGRLDEELGRMGRIAERIGPGGMLLCNESFSSTNEREGSEMARQVVRAMVESGVRVFFVTHLYDLARSLYDRRDGGMLFLRAERLPDGSRTFRLLPGEPLPTSYGWDSYRRIFDVRA